LEETVDAVPNMTAGDVVAVLQAAVSAVGGVFERTPPFVQQCSLQLAEHTSKTYEAPVGVLDSLRRFIVKCS
jgi:hypothetical protein